MMVGIQGSKSFNDYAIFLSGMALVLRKLKELDNNLVIFSAGPKRVSDMALEFINVSNFKSRGITAKMVKVPESFLRDNHYKLESFHYFCNEREPFSNLVNVLDSKDVDVQVHRYHTVK
jgi:hypothetical protein